MTMAVEPASSPRSSLKARYKARLAAAEASSSRPDTSEFSRQCYIAAAAVLDAFTFS